MRIGGSGTIEVNVLPSGGGVMRGNDIVSDEDRIFVSPFTLLSSVSSEFGMQQLFNPVGSGVDLLLDWLTVFPNSQTSCEIWMQTVALGNDQGDWVSRVDGVTAGKAEMRDGTNATVPGVFICELREVTASVQRDFGAFIFPFIVRPGEGLAVVCGAVTEILQIMWMGREV